MKTLEALFRKMPDFLSSTFFEEHQRLFKEEEHLSVLAKRLISFLLEGVPVGFPLPHFEVECTPSLNESYAFFEPALQEWYQEGDKESDFFKKKFATVFERAGCSTLLILLGQRQTPASLTDARGIPPVKEFLLKTASKEFSQGLTVGARAWTKHTNRSSDGFWGEVKGTTAEKNEKAYQIISYILENTTWWNVFGHYKHDIVYEARVSSGQGVRWGKSGEELIGFLEPFLNEQDS